MHYFRIGNDRPLSFERVAQPLRRDCFHIRNDLLQFPGYLTDKTIPTIISVDKQDAPPMRT
jgi:hypothetical protein